MPQTRLSLATWRDIAAYLRESQLVILPVGSTEQHGPNGLLGTDAICAEAVANAVGEEVGALVAPTLSLGVAMHHMAFPGTVTLTPETFIRVLSEVVRSLFQHGLRQFLCINGHGGNTASAMVAFAGLREELAGAHFEWVSWWQVEPVSAYAREHFGAREGSHASPTEVSLSMVAAPGAVVPVAGPLDLEICRPRGIPGSTRFREIYPDGRIGSDPSLATEEHGRALLRCAAEAISPLARRLKSAAAREGSAD